VEAKDTISKIAFLLILLPRMGRGSDEKSRRMPGGMSQ
jgi:hypothetical protein